MAAHPNRSRATLAAALLATLLGIACDWGTPATGAQTGPADRSSRLIGGKLDPEQFREQIEALEAALYLKRSEQPEDYARVGAAVLDLVNAISGKSSTTVARTAGGKLLFFSARAETGHEDPRIESLAPIRREWERLRAEYFAPASWFQRSAPEQARGSRGARGSSTELAAVAEVVSGLEELLLRGRLEVIGLGEPRYRIDFVDATGQAQIDRWRAWSVRWKRSVRKLTANLPPRPGPAGPRDLLLAIEGVELAVLDLERIDQGEGAWATPFRKEWEARFARAERSLREARRHLPES